jgi:hypothetical protein
MPRYGEVCLEWSQYGHNCFVSARFGHGMIFSKLWFLYNKTKQGDIYECPNLADVKYTSFQLSVLSALSYAERGHKSDTVANPSFIPQRIDRVGGGGFDGLNTDGT